MISAGFFKRIFSLLYDTLIIAGIILSLTLLLVFINGKTIVTGSILSYAELAILFFTGPIFYCYFWLQNHGQTIGMQAWKIKVVSISGARITLKQCVLRCIGSILGFCFMGMGYLNILFNSDNKAWADIFSSTRIIYLKPPKT